MKIHIPKLIPAGQLNPAAYNPNVMTPEEFAALKASIRTDGFVEPIVVQKKGMRIVGGHHRVRAVKEICIEDSIAVPKIPCVVLELDDARAKKLNVKLQHIHGSPDAKLLGEILIDIFQEEPFAPQEVALLGLGFDEASKYVRIADPEFLPAEPPGAIADFGRSITMSVEFTDVATRDRVKKLLAERAEMEKAKPGDVLAKILAPAHPKKSKSIPPTANA